MKKIGILVAAFFLMVGFNAEAQCNKSSASATSSCCAKKGKAKVASAHAHKMDVKAKGPCCIEGVKTAEYSNKKERRMAIKAFKKAQKNMDAKSDACCSKEASAAVIREE